MSERPPQEFIDALREAEDQILAQTPTRPQHKVELLETLLERDTRRRRPLARLFEARAMVGAGAALALGALALFALTSDATEDATRPELPDAAHVALGLSAPAECSSNAIDDAVALDSGCTFTWATHSGTFEVAPGDEAHVRREGDALRVARGRVLVDIDPERPAPKRVDLRVSRGTIQVLGTSFTIEERGDEGRVTLHRGTIRFVPDVGEPVTLSPGESHAWGAPEEHASAEPSAPEPAEATPEELAPEPTPEVAPKATEATKATKKRPSGTTRVSAKAPKRERIETGSGSLGALQTVSASELQQLRQLRRMKRYPAALRALSEFERRRLDRATREVLSYERGELLELSGDSKRACSHWRKHLKKFSKGSYRRQIERRLPTLECSED